MKKLLALLLAAVMCFSLVACGGGETPNTDNNSSIQQDGQTTERDTQQGAETSNIQDSSNETKVDYLEILLNESNAWYVVNGNARVGSWFRQDGTLDGGTWELVDNIVTVISEESTASYEIKAVDGVYYLVGDRLLLSKIQPEDIPAREVEITIDNWQEYFELASASKEEVDTFGDPTGEVETYNCLKLKDEYYKYFIYEKSDVRIRYIFNGYEDDDFMTENWHHLMPTYFGSPVPSADDFEMVKVQGTLYFVDGI